MIDAAQFIGKVLDEQYRVVKEIGSGASSVVFYAEDLLMKQDNGEPMPVAVKILDNDSNEYKLNTRSFEAESRAVVDIPANSHTVAVQDVREDRELDIHFIVMEYVKGKTLRHFMKEHGAFSAREIVSISLQMLFALKNAHEAGVVHRDVKPQNILVKEDVTPGEASELPGGAGMPYVKLADFGIALLPDEDLFAMTDRGVGTVHYVSPEQAGGSDIDARSDLYSLGVVMYELATGRVPFDADSATAVITQHQTAAPIHARTFNPNIPLSLDKIIFTAMQKDPHKRYRDAATMEKKLFAVLRELDGLPPLAEREDSAPRPTPHGSNAPAPKPKKPKARKAPVKIPKAAWIASLGAVAVALLIILGVVLTPIIKDSFGSGDITVTIPKLIGTVYDENATYADGITVVPSYVHSNDVEKGYIISQDQGVGKVVNGKVTIGVTVSLGPEMIDFSVPAEKRVDYMTAKSYLTDTYYLLEVLRFEVRDYNGQGTEGAVIGAKFVNGEEISLDNGQIPDTKTQIILILNGSKKINFVLPEAYRADRVSAKNYIESTYAGIVTVSDETRSNGAIVSGVAPFGVVAFYHENGTRHTLDGTSLDANIPFEIILVLNSLN